MVLGEMDVVQMKLSLPVSSALCLTSTQGGWFVPHQLVAVTNFWGRGGRLGGRRPLSPEYIGRSGMSDGLWRGQKEIGDFPS